MPRFTFTLRLVAMTTVAVAIAVAISSTVVYQKWKATLGKEIAAELLAVVNSAAPMIDGDLHEIVFRVDDETLDGLEEFELIRHQLIRVRDANRLEGPGSPIYTMRPAADYERSGWLEFVVMTDRGVDGKYFVGNRYRAQAHNRSALQGIGMASNIYTDDEGSWISASAPILDSQGNVVGLLQADRPVRFFEENARAEAWSMVRTGSAAVLIGALIAIVAARGLARPLGELVRAAEAIGLNQFDYRVRITRSDEIGELAESFNTMAAQLAAHDRRLDTALKNAEDDKSTKSELMTMMATWVRTPAERVVELADQLEQSLDDDERAKLTSSLRIEAESCLSLIDELQPQNDEDMLSRSESSHRRGGEMASDPSVSEVVGARSSRLSRAKSSVESQRILLVEDNLDLQRSATDVLIELGYSVDCAEDGERALALLGQRSFDFVLMDCQMPGIDGFEATRRWRASEVSTQRLPIIGLMTEVSPERRERCDRVGMDDVLSKPIGRTAVERSLSALHVG